MITAARIEKKEFASRAEAEHFFYQKIQEGVKNTKFWWRDGAKFSVEYETAA